MLEMRTGFLISGLLLLVLANLLAMYGFGVRGYREGFTLANAAPTGKDYKPMGPFDGVSVSSENAVSQWRYNSPNEPLQGPAFQPGPDSLFMFKNNQCKPECCGASYACDGGCVCTTPDQRQYLATRGGNRTVEDGF